MSRNFDTLNDVYAVLLGVINKQEAKITRAQFNSRLEILSLDKISKNDFKLIVDEVKSSPNLKDIFEKASYGVYTMKDLSDITGVTVEEKDEHNLLTNYVVDRAVDRAQIRAFNRAQSKGVAQQYLSQEISKEIVSSLKDLPTYIKQEYKEPVIKGRTLVVTPSDWHIGARVDISANEYNYEIAEQRLAEYTKKVIEAIHFYNPSEVLIVHLGDFIEGIDMRNINQAFEADMDATTQLATAIRMYTRFILEIAQNTNKVTVGAIGGNHDRFTSNKKEAIYNDNMAYNVVDTLLMMKEYGAIPDNVYIINNKDDIYSLDYTVSGKNLLFVHGDKEDRRDVPKITKHIKDKVFDYMFLGHYHFIKTLQEDYARMSFMVGSLIGANNYSKQIGAPFSRPSQQITLITEGSDNPVIMPIYL